jgi:kynurenine formamidase
LQSSQLGVESTISRSNPSHTPPTLTTLDWTKRGGIIGRGVLLDYVDYAERKNISYSPMSDHAINVQELEDMAKDAGVTFLPGDILLIRVGWTKWYDEHNEDDRAEYVTNAYAWAGLKGCEEMLEWLWDHHFAAVASDNNGVEVVPMDDSWRELRL